MKKSFLLIVCAVVLVLGFSSCGNNTTIKEQEEPLGQEETKKIAASQIKFYGEHGGFFNVATDSVTVKLVNVDSTDWDIRAIVPIGTNMSFKEFCEANRKPHHKFYQEASTFALNYFDANDDEINYQADSKDIYDVVKNILSATGNASANDIHIVGNQYSGWSRMNKNENINYSKAKTIFDKLSSISIKIVVRDEYCEESNPTYDDIISQAQRMADDAMNQAQKMADDAMKSAQERAKQLGY